MAVPAQLQLPTTKKQMYLQEVLAAAASEAAPALQVAAATARPWEAASKAASALQGHRLLVAMAAARPEEAASKAASALQVAREQQVEAGAWADAGPQGASGPTSAPSSFYTMPRWPSATLQLHMPWPAAEPLAQPLAPTASSVE